jgi:hypothetical protein
MGISKQMMFDEMEAEEARLRGDGDYVCPHCCELRPASTIVFGLCRACLAE